MTNVVTFIPRKGKGCKIVKLDLQQANHQIPVDPTDISLLGIQIDDEFYFHLALPFEGHSCVLSAENKVSSVYAKRRTIIFYWGGGGGEGGDVSFSLKKIVHKL